MPSIAANRNAPQNVDNRLDVQSIHSDGPTQDKRTSRREPFEIEDGQMQSPTLGTDIVPALVTVH